LLDAPILEHGHPLGEVIALLEQDVVRPGGNPASPGYLAYIPGGGLYHSALGDSCAAVSNKYAGIFFAGPGPVRMEHLLVRWVADLVGYPATAAGNIRVGRQPRHPRVDRRRARGARPQGSRLRERGGLPDHPGPSLHREGAPHRGPRRAPVRHVPMDDGFRMRPDALAECIAADRAAGLRRGS